MLITPHFSGEEAACRSGVPYPKEWIADRLVPLFQQLEVVRAYFSNKPITINSLYRTPQYNALVGGALHSQHMLGRAADFTVWGFDAIEVQQGVLDLYHDGRLTIGGLGSYRYFTHLDVRVNVSGQLAQWVSQQ